MILTISPLTPDAPAIVPAPRSRKWLDTYANSSRCLPFTIANQSGWWILNPVPFTATALENGEVSVQYDKGWKEPLAKAHHHFGHGVLTIDIPYLWRTESNWNLHIRGPANMPLLGAFPLEGIMETDWADIPIPANWQLEPTVPVRFEKDFPIAQVVPVQRGILDHVEPTIEFSQEALDRAHAYYLSREKDYSGIDPGRKLTGYFNGDSPDGNKFKDHQINVNCKEFKIIEMDRA